MVVSPGTFDVDKSSADTICTGFSKLPEHVQKLLLSHLCRLLAIIRISEDMSSSK